MTRNEAREIMMQILFELDASKAIENDKTPDRAQVKEKAAELTSERLPGAHAERGETLIYAILDNIDKADSEINSCSTKWKTGRMPKVDLAIMRLAYGEIMYCDDIPEAVTISEAVNLAKKFSTGNSGRFVHGVLGALTRKKDR